MDCIRNGCSSYGEDDQNLLSESEVILQQRAQFELAIESIVSKKDQSGQLICASIQRKLHQFNLARSYSVAHILNAVYLIGVDQIENGYIIYNPRGWIRTVAFRQIQKISIEGRNFVEFDEERGSAFCQDDSSDEIPELDLACIRIAFHQLSLFSQKLLSMKLIKGMTWKQIRHALVQAGDGDYQETVLRKRKERALEKLKELYWQVKLSQTQDQQEM